MNLPLAKLSAVQEPTREADVFDKTRWTSLELLVLAAKYRDAASKLEAARASASFDGLRHAYQELQNIRDQTSHMLEGLHRAIEKEVECRNA